MARTKVARTRLTEAEYAKHVKEPARIAGVSEGEYLRNLIVSRLELEERVASIEHRLEHVETEIARMWSQEGRHHDQQVN